MSDLSKLTKPYFRCTFTKKLSILTPWPYMDPKCKGPQCLELNFSWYFGTPVTLYLGPESGPRYQESQNTTKCLTVSKNIQLSAPPHPAHSPSHFIVYVALYHMFPPEVNFKRMSASFLIYCILESKVFTLQNTSLLSITRAIFRLVFFKNK